MSQNIWPRKKHVIWMMALTGSLFFAPKGHAGAWPIAQGHGQAISTVELSTASKAFNASGDAVDPVGFTKINASIYLEHGLTQKWTLVAQATAQDVSISNQDTDESFSGFSRVELAARRTLRKTDWSVLSVQAAIDIHQGGENVPDGNLDLTGNSYLIRVLYGRGLLINDRNGFLEAQIGYRVRDNALPDEWSLDLTAGLYVFDRVQIIGQLFGLKGQGAQFPVRDYESLKAQAGLVYDRNQEMSVKFGVFRTLAGRDIIEETGLMTGLILRY